MGKITTIRYATAFLLTVVYAGSDCPFPLCAACLPASIHDAPGIGFDLTYSYGTSVAKLHNGSIIDIAKVNPTPEYLSLIAQLTNASSPPPLSRLEKGRRYLNKKMGWPSTPGVAILSSMLIALRDETSSVLSLSPESIQRVVVTRPPLPGLREEDLTDALDYAGLSSWLITPPESHAGLYPETLDEDHAVFAGNGNGLCTTYKNLFECWEEDKKMPIQTLFVAIFTKQALYTAAGIMRNPFHWLQMPLKHITDLDAGLGSMAKYKSPAEFWAHIRSRLESFAQESAAETGPITKIILAGENATHPDFITALRNSLNPFASGGSSIEEIETVFADPTFASARGAALYARWRQEAPYGCMELKKCEEERKKERERLIDHQGDLEEL